MNTFRRALELAAGERSGEPVPSVWRNWLKDYPHGCCELASQTLTAYLKEDGSNLHPYIIGTEWNEGSGAHSQAHGHDLHARLTEALMPGETLEARHLHPYLAAVRLPDAFPPMTAA